MPTKAESASADEQLLTVDEVASRLRVHEWTVRRWLKVGELDGYKIARKWRIRPSAVHRFLDERAAADGLPE